jgi:bacterial leucyl aminopeptidase
VVVSAHMDSTAGNEVAYRASQDPAPGADDDGSGVAAVVTIAERFAAMTMNQQLERTVRFLVFNAEEEGLVGSQAYASYQRSIEAPVIAVLQMDMIGYNKQVPRSWEIHAGFSRSSIVEDRSASLGAIIAQLVERVSPQLPLPQLYRSDHASFHVHDYPSRLSSEDLFPGPGSHAPVEKGNPEYHRRTDTFIDAEFAADIARAVAATAWLLAVSSVESTR